MVPSYSETFISTSKYFFFRIAWLFQTNIENGPGGLNPPCSDLLPDFPCCYGTQRCRIFFLRKFNEIAVSIFGKPVRTFCQMEQCNFSTSKIERGERFPFVGKTGENFPPIWNSTLPHTDRVIPHSTSSSIDQGAWHTYDRANGTVIYL